MPTSVTITGSGVPMIAPGRAGPGALIRHEETALQVDCGRATALRLTEADVNLGDLTAMLITHHHSDHLLGLADVVLTRWIAHGPRPCPPLPIHCPDGPIVDYLEHLFDGLEPDIQSRVDILGYPSGPEPDVATFAVPADGASLIGSFGEVMVEAIAVRHGGVVPAVAYRFTTPDGVVVISGDTTVCPELEGFAGGADILVHEAFSADLMRHRQAPPARIEAMAKIHADVRAVGAMARRLDVAQLVITHMIPSPNTPEDGAMYADGIRDGGYEGDLAIADDLHVARIPA